MSYDILTDEQNGINDIDKDELLGIFCVLQLHYRKSAEQNHRGEYETALDYSKFLVQLSKPQDLIGKNGRVSQLYLILEKYGINDNEDILTEVLNLDEEHPIKQGINKLCSYREVYTTEKNPATRIRPTFFYLEYSMTYQNVPTYDYFLNNFTGDIINKIIISAESYFLQEEQNAKTEKRKLLHPSKRNFYFQDFMNNFNNQVFYFDCKYEEETEWSNITYKYEVVNYNILSAKMTDKSKELLKSLLKEYGFPYGNNYSEYVRFMNNIGFNKCISMRRLFKEDVSFYDLNAHIYFSYLLKLFVPSPIKPKQFLNHTHIVGRSGSGKSEFLKTIIKQVGESCILLDPHGDIADSLDKKQNFFKIAPTESRFVINPFDIEDKSIDNRELVAEEIIQLLQEIIQDSNVSVLMKTISFPIISTLLKLPYADFRMLADCINPISGIEHLERLTPLVDDHLKHIWNDLKTDTYDTTKRSIFNRLQSFLNKHKIVSTVCGYDDFNNAIKRVEQGENLVISLPIPQLGEDVSEVLGRFFMCRMQIWAKRRQTLAEKDRKPVLLIVDECQNYLSEETARTLDQFGRKFGLYMVLAHQHIAQIDGKGLKGSMLANCKNKIVGYCDESTAKPMGNAIGVSYEEFTELKKGHWWGLFEDQKPLKFYARLAKFKTVSEAVNYAQSQNTDFLDGWGLVQDEMKNPTKTTPKTPKFTAKFDL